MDERFERIDLSRIEPNPHNPRKNFSGEEFDDLVASIIEKGVIEPVIVRPLNGHGTYQLIAGERRFRASFQAGKIDIPAIVRPYSDEEALEVMAIENLQRDDLTEIEEARGFKTYLDLKGGPRAIEELAKAVGKSTTYIRRRVKVLELPGDVLKLWETGELIYSHLEQLIRLDNGKNAISIARQFISDTAWNPTVARTAQKLADYLTNRSPALADALFVREICSDCPKNTEVQKTLFGDEAFGKEARCLDPSCFKHHQNDWLLSHWHETEPARKYCTNGFRFYESKGEYHSIDTPREKCKSCGDFVTTVSLSGKASWPAQCCMKGDCFKTTYTSRSQAKPYRPPLGPEFREKFFRAGLSKQWAETPLDDDRMLRVFLAWATDDHATGEAFIKTVLGGLTEQQKAEGTMLGKWQAIEALSGQELKDALTKALVIRLKEQTYWLSGLYPHLANHFGIHLEDWKVSAEYLNKKDPKELVKLAKELNILGDQAVIDWMAKKHKGKKLSELDKKGLVALFLKSGVDLTGKVPKEILGDE